MDQDVIKISVRNLVEFVLRQGDLDNRFTSNVRALEGTRIHQKIQQQYKDKIIGDKSATYNCEVSLKYEIIYRKFKFLIEGRADGIILEDDCVTIDEIKTVTRPLEMIDATYNPLHLAQVKCYAYIYAYENKLDYICVQLTYYNINDHKVKFIKEKINIEDLRRFFIDILDKYYKWVELKKDWNDIRNKSIDDLKFPFKSYRTGQRKLAAVVYGTIRDKKRLFVQAPTGIGKTISTIFPSIKALATQKLSTIFYLTAKTTTRATAEETLKIMFERGLRLKSITITAKEKVCLNDDTACNPEHCEYARGHYNRVNEAIFEIINSEDLITRDKIIKYSKKFQICPFEFCLDTALFCDYVICDYNYAFNPRVYLRRFFDESSEKNVLLIDEAHNLVDRSRDMFSAEIYKKSFLHIKKFIKKEDNKILKCLNKINSYMLDLKKNCNLEFKDLKDKLSGDIVYIKKNIYAQKSKMSEIYFLLKNFSSQIEEWMIKNAGQTGYDEILDEYFTVNNFIRIYEIYNDNFITYIENMAGDLKVKILCIDPSTLLDERMKSAEASILFSATLSPMNYFKDILGGRAEDYNMTLLCPFERRNREILISSNISTVYRSREESCLPIINYIKTVVSRRTGNYIVFFPSYGYMDRVYELFIEKFPDVKTSIQKSGMSESEREKFLNDFKEDSKESFISFAVLGGLFSEGIDLKGDKLIGSIIVGVGLPKISFERDIIMDFFNKKNGLGYEYSYMYPGMNKILQAAGRVIRTESDRGVILLIDKRFMTVKYKKLFPREWYPNHIIDCEHDIESILKVFWDE
ncbi:ATP-dependent DNA helicase [Clostridium tyrobutyricum]|jgi:Rad3-related DNA helicase|uniref:ATP-dependent DNA helicase n=1 Tax=Clostridium tyrobutyricum TaxID=1519 RepID=UPI001C37F0E8|nr:ATP-dependent DNA helicase [Clostridium tyrobutyricum]MBV4450065.1 ATP-dependent DNA helicase [Clostridium tyrobutyricum]MCH4237699.1 ATP-dependent DNA helicase [Clostridium tyrobutyricum]MCH4257781.1 ATP-dependent DNA helicase [Clostridium tyrobutyricum]MCI1238760.1 ATP-dependent DNA helicase [Clostridium tyrobutyricum]MCI1652565.1 ATP-dependent DNA helicase [Clostridium tyrobutyricum]